MLRSQAFKSSRRLLATASEASAPVKAPKGTIKSWAEAPTPISALKVKYQPSRDALLNGVPASGPPSLRSRNARAQYRSPIGLNEAFDEAYALLKNKATETYKEIEELDSQITQEKPGSKKLEALKEQKVSKLVEAEINNPEVRFNFTYNDRRDNNSSVIDYDHPAYRQLQKEQFEGYGQMLVMQRLEQLKCIPDTLPTVDPRAEISLQFLNPTAVNKWVEPGSILPTHATQYPPSIKIQEFDAVDPTKQLYTILIVNPDVPDLEVNSYKTQLHWGLSNVKISFNNNYIGPKQLLEDKSINELVEYLPPVPEKNLPNQRFVTWVFRQPKEIESKVEERDFDIREFAAKWDLQAIGGHVWRSHWDTSVAKVRELYGLPKGTVYHRVRR